MLEQPQSGITLVTQLAPDLTCLMIVVNAKLMTIITFLRPTNRAITESVVLVERDTILLEELIGTSADTSVVPVVDVPLSSFCNPLISMLVIASLSYCLMLLGMPCPVTLPAFPALLRVTLPIALLCFSMFGVWHLSMIPHTINPCLVDI